MVDAVVVGSGPNGLAAALRLAQAGRSVVVLEAHSRPGGGTLTEELTLPGYHHDVCSAIHPTGVLSPYLRTLPLGAHGLAWRHPAASVAHPLDGGRAVVLSRSLQDTVAQLGEDAPAYRRLVEPFLGDPHGLMEDILGPLRWPKSPWRLARFGLLAIRSASGLARSRFRTEEARALFAGCAAHSILPLESLATAALGLVFSISAHVVDWPCVEGGSEYLARAMASLLRSWGGEIRCGVRIRRFAELPVHRVALFDTSPARLADIAQERLPSGYVSRLRRFRYGPGVFKVDWALDGPIPWTNGACNAASTVHVGGTIEEIARAEAQAWRGENPEFPFVLVCQQSHFDESRAPTGKHTGYAYCHVPSGSMFDFTERIESQIERFAPGFRGRILARHAMSPAWLEAHNANCVGGAVTGGAADVWQLFTRPVARWNPYTTPNPKILLCSASTPPGGGVHGMCGYWAAEAALRRGGPLDR